MIHLIDFFAVLDTHKFEKNFREWVNSISKKTINEVISIDGKTIKRAKVHGNKSSIDMVSVWANSNSRVTRCNIYSGLYHYH